MSRISDYTDIVNALDSKINYKDDVVVVVNDDSLNALKLIPDHSISLILTDPPYHSTKKENIVNDKSFGTDEEFLNWMESFAIEWKRIIKPNGSIFMFCSSAMESQLHVMLSKRFNILSHLVWTKPNEPGYDGWKGKMKKEALRQWYPQSERIIFFEPAVEGNLNRSYFGDLLKKTRNSCHLSGHELTERIGAYGSVNHGGAVSNWETGRNIPSREQYEKMQKVFAECQCPINLPAYEDAIRPFEVNGNIEFTDIWTFPSVKPYKGKHPAEKPIEMLEHCINATTYEGDIVLDCFAGSGSTGVAALRTKRKGICIEIDQKWSTTIVKRLSIVKNLPQNYSMSGQSLMRGSAQKEESQTLFDFACDPEGDSPSDEE